MKLQLMAVLLSLAPVSFAQQGSQSYFTGTAINTTDAGNPVAAPVRISLSGNDCKLTVSAPLLGSGNCVVKTFDQKSGHLEIVSYGPPAITWTGTLKGNFASGTYQISIGSQTGSFYLALLREAEAAPRVVPPTPVNPYSAPVRSSCVPAVESSISGSVEGWKGETIFKLFQRADLAAG